MTLTKADIALKVAERCGFMRNEASEIIEKLLEIMKSRLISGEDVMISGFGKWSVKSKSARRGRNPQTGDQYFWEREKLLLGGILPCLKSPVITHLGNDS